MTLVKQQLPHNVNNIFDELFSVPPTFSKALQVPPVNIYEGEEGFQY